MPPPSPKTFAKLLRQKSPEPLHSSPLYHLTFFLGAGFAKSWDASFPTGDELFKVGSDELSLREATSWACDAFDLDRSGGLTLAKVKQLVYSVDMHLAYPSVRSRYVDREALLAVRDDLRAFFFEHFRKIVGKQWQWHLPTVPKFTDLKPSVSQLRIFDLFGKAFKLLDGSSGATAGARLNFITTNYDNLVEVILSHAVEEDDSVFQYLYRGVTPRRICGTRELTNLFRSGLTFNLLKLHGGFEILPVRGGYEFEYRERSSDDIAERPPLLMLPSRQQDYASAYFRSVFTKSVRLLQDSTALIIVGYALSDEDALLRFVLRHFCEDRADARGKWVFYIDLKLTEAEQLDKLRSIYPFVSTEQSDPTRLRAVPYRGSFDEWAFEVVRALHAH